MSVIKNDRQEITHYFAFCHDITELKRKEKQISILAYSDALTKLPNRAALEHRLTKAIARAGRERRTLAVFFIDLDNFKNINDSLGHNIGDQVLIEVAERLSATIRSEDTLSRLGGDEFILLSESIDNENAVYNLASRILASLKQPILLPPNTIYVNASIGIALFPNDGQTSLDLIKNADMAMYKAKSEGKNKFVMFTQEMNEKLLNRIRVESAIRTGLKQREFAVYYQPKINIISELPTSFEALVRWQNNGTIVTPDQFIPIAEESGLIDEMSLYVLDEVCIFLAKMDEHQLQRLPISVNMAPRTFNQKNIVETSDTILRAHRIDHRFIEFEITETTAMKNVQHTLEIMRLFRERGIRFAIDDFGTGYSSLTYLSEMPVSTLKIDKRFINAGDATVSRIVFLFFFYFLHHFFFFFLGFLCRHVQQMQLIMWWPFFEGVSATPTAQSFLITECPSDALNVVAEGVETVTAALAAVGSVRRGPGVLLFPAHAGSRCPGLSPEEQRSAIDRACRPAPRLPLVCSGRKARWPGIRGQLNP